MNITKNLEKAQKRFYVYSLLGLVVIILASIIGGFYYLKFFKQQEKSRVLDNKLEKQFRLLNDIYRVSKSLEDKSLVTHEIVAVQDNIKVLVGKLKSERKKLSTWIEVNNINVIKDFEDDLEDKELDEQISLFITKVNKIASTDTEKIELLRENNDFLSKLSKTSLRKDFRFMSRKINQELKENLTYVKNFGLFFIFSTFLIIFCIWFFVFKPMYESVVESHNKSLEALYIADSANRSKTDFLANVSHEIRTPMTAILGYAEVLKEANDSDRKNATDIINRNASHLLGLIDDLLDISKIEAGKINFHIEKIDTEAAISEVFSLINVKASEKEIDLIVNQKGKVPRFMISDLKRLKQILFNIVGNAIKFTEKGYVEMVSSYNKDDQRIIFQITDTGCGIPAKDIPRLFKPFSQADSSNSRKYQGTGLGLALSRDLARGLGGDLWIKKSVLDEGSVFVISLPVGEVDVELTDINIAIDGNIHSESESESDSDRPQNLVPDLEGYNILVVDDAKENARLFKHYLQETKANIFLAHDGQQAFEEAISRKTDLVFMDLQMPVLNGYESVKLLRESGYKSPIIALTAHAMIEEVEKTQRSGFDDHITKPTTQKILFEACRKFLLSNV